MSLILPQALRKIDQLEQIVNGQKQMIERMQEARKLYTEYSDMLKVKMHGREETIVMLNDKVVRKDKAIRELRERIEIIERY